MIRFLNEDGVPVRRINFEAATTSPLPDWTPGSINDSDLAGCVWWRQFDAYDYPPDSLPEADERLIARAQWKAWCALLDTPKTVWINPLWSARRAENKVVQLRTATAVGFEVPQTIVTNSRDRAKSMTREMGGLVVVKTLSAAYYELSSQAFVYTELLTDRLMAETSLEEWARQPMLIQELISAESDARLVIMGEHEMAGKLDRNEAVDWRTTKNDSWTEWHPPDVLVRKARAFMETLGLVYTAFDFLVDGDRIWFLEANQAGEWDFLDRRLGAGFSRRIATYLRTARSRQTT